MVQTGEGFWTHNLKWKRSYAYHDVTCKYAQWQWHGGRGQGQLPPINFDGGRGGAPPKIFQARWRIQVDLCALRLDAAVPVAHDRKAICDHIFHKRDFDQGHTKV